MLISYIHYKWYKSIFTVFHIKLVFSSFFPIFLFCSFFQPFDRLEYCTTYVMYQGFCFDLRLVSVSSGVHCYEVSHFSSEEKNFFFISIVVRFRIHFISFHSPFVEWHWGLHHTVLFRSGDFYHYYFLFFSSSKHSSRRWMVVFFCWFAFMGQ